LSKVTNLDVTRGFDIGLAEPVQISGGLEISVDRSRLRGDPLGYNKCGYVFAGDRPAIPNVGKLASIVRKPASSSLRPTGGLTRAMWQALFDIAYACRVYVRARGASWNIMTNASGTTAATSSTRYDIPTDRGARTAEPVSARRR